MPPRSSKLVEISEQSTDSQNQRGRLIASLTAETSLIHNNQLHGEAFLITSDITILQDANYSRLTKTERIQTFRTLQNLPVASLNRLFKQTFHPCGSVGLIQRRSLNLRDQLSCFLSLRDGHYKSHWSALNDGIKFETNQCPLRRRSTRK